MDALEFTGEDIEAAIAAGLAYLGVSPNDVLVEVLEEPRSGVFGIGARPAKVRLKPLRPLEPKPTSQVEDYADYDDESADADDYYAAGISAASDADEGEAAREILSQLLQKMGVRGEVSARRADPTHPGESAPWMLDIDGPDMSLLIGRRGETLSSLQYITRLMVSRRLQRRANLIVDAGGYKSRRSERLRQLALRMADQAVQEERTVTLEPMPPNERRIIHLALRGRSDVETRSTGEGTARKVTIVPKNA